MTPTGAVLVAGASGFVGRRLCTALTEAGHGGRAMTQHPDSYTGEREAVYSDMHELDQRPPRRETLLSAARRLGCIEPGSLVGTGSLRARGRSQHLAMMHP